MARKKLLTQTQQAMLDGQWQQAAPLAADDPFVAGGGFVDGLRRMPAGTVVGDHDVSGWVTARLVNTDGVAGLVHLRGDSESESYRAAVHAPKGYPVGWTMVGGDDPATAVVLCRTLADAWGVHHSATAPVTCAVYWAETNLPHVIKALSGRALGYLVDPVQAAERAADLAKIDWSVVTRIDVEYPARQAFEWQVNIGAPIDAWAAAYYAAANKQDSSLPPAPSDAHNILQDSNEAFSIWTLPQMEQEIILLYGTDFVWDCRNRVQMRLSALRHAVGKTLFTLWDDSPARKTARGITFDPTQKCGRAWVNIFQPLPVYPRMPAARCRRILDHVMRLCSGREQEYQWLLRWMAYPLQHVGAKMDTAIVVMGAEGTGKSLFWHRIYGALFGEYTKIIGQAELESSFNGWMSQLILAICEEVVSRDEQRHHKGKLKNMITSAMLSINEKNLPMRQEPNHINFVFLSNESIPMILDQGDRRYMVLHTNDVPDGEYFEQLWAEVQDGGLAAFCHYLLDLDLGEFNQHTKPPRNEEKLRLIEAGLPNTLLFVKEWRDGVLDLPYISCKREDLFRAYCAWCVARKAFVRDEKIFFNDLASHGAMTPSRHDICYPRADAPRKTHRLWLTEDDARAVAGRVPDAIKKIQTSANRFVYMLNGEDRLHVA